VIVLPFPSSILSGHAEQGRWAKARAVKEHREWARLATLEELPTVCPQGDIRVHVRFVRPDMRGDRVNFPNRMKPYFDGIADALGVNDARFLPSYEFAEPEKPGRVEVTVGGQLGEKFPTHEGSNPLKESGPDKCGNTASGPDHQSLVRSDQ
jgi:hypothetical protein